MDKSKIFLSLLVPLLFPFALAAQSITNQELTKSCSEKTIVTGYDEAGKIVKIGESVDGFCSGFIRASFAAFERDKPCDRLARSEIDVNFLLSIYQQYIQDKSPNISQDAFQTLQNAFSRIPRCNAKD